MRAELMVLGKPVDLSQQTRRRQLVVWVYAALALAMTALAWLDGWRTSGYYLVFFALALNHLLLGGYGRGGLVRPFNGKPPQPASPPPYLLLGLHLRLSAPGDGDDWRSDEREVARRDRAHYTAYQALAVVLAALWLLATAVSSSTGWAARFHPQIAAALHAVALGGVILMVTLPQAILLWTEPDMSDFAAEDSC